MGYGWQQSAEAEAPPQAEKIPKGSGIRLKIIKLVGGKGESRFASKSGNPKIGIVFQDREARECMSMYTLSAKAGWTLAKLLSCCDPPVNLARMEEAGVVPSYAACPKCGEKDVAFVPTCPKCNAELLQFSDLEFAEANLLNRQLTADLDYDAGGYPVVSPIKPATSAPPAADAPPSSDAPPVVDAPPPSTGYTKDEAWAAVCKHWTGEDTAQRNAKWVESIRTTGKKEADLTPAEWARVVDLACPPF
jgi:hypothetical protein